MRRRAAIGLLALVAAACTGPGFVVPGAPYVATPEPVGHEMLRLAVVGPDDVVYDLGSGDGRLVIAAARDFGARGVGVEIDPRLVDESQEHAVRAGVADRVRFVWQDLFVTPLREATVVTLYLGDALNLRLRPRLLGELAPGTRIVSHDFALGDWRPDRSVTLPGAGHDHRLHLWIVPAAVEGRWRLALADGRRGIVELRQSFQTAAGTLTVGDRRSAVEGRVRGDRLSLSGPVRLDGRVTGATASGLRVDADGTPVAWTARREPAR